MKRILSCCLLLLFTTGTVFSQTEFNDSINQRSQRASSLREAGWIDKEGFILPDITLPTSTSYNPMKDRMTLRIEMPSLAKTPWPTPRLGTGGNPWANDYNQ